MVVVEIKNQHQQEDWAWDDNFYFPNSLPISFYDRRLIGRIITTFDKPVVDKKFFYNYKKI